MIDYSLINDATKCRAFRPGDNGCMAVCEMSVNNGNSSPPKIGRHAGDSERYMARRMSAHIGSPRRLLCVNG